MPDVFNRRFVQSLDVGSSPTFAALTLDEPAEESQMFLKHHPAAYGEQEYPGGVADFNLVHYVPGAAQSGGYKNYVYSWGYNTGMVNHRENSDEPGYSFVLETRYNGAAGERWFESYQRVNQVGLDATEFRPHMIVAKLAESDGSLSAVGQTFKCTGTGFFSFEHDGGQHLKIDNSLVQIGLPLHISVYNKYISSKNNAGGTCYWIELGGNGTDVLSIGAAGVGKIAGVFVVPDGKLRAKFESNTLTFLDNSSVGYDVVLPTGVGTKWGTATTQKQGWWNAAPTTQPASANQAQLSLDVDVTGSDTVDKAAINANFTAIQTLVNQLRADLVTIGLIKGAA